MRDLFQIFLIISSTFLFADCASNTSAIPVTKIQNDFPDACQEWQRRYDELSENQKESFKREKIIYPNNYPYLLGEKLVQNCSLRVEIGAFIQKTIGGTSNKQDKKFASENSKEIVRVIKYIWNSDNFSVDGVSHEKYLPLIKETGIKDDDIAPFIGQLIKAEGIHSEESEVVSPDLKSPKFSGAAAIAFAPRYATITTV